MATIPNTPNNIGNYVYDAGFVHASWSDTVLQIGNFEPFHLHALFLSRSPVLYQHLTSIAPPNVPIPLRSITIPSDDPNLTPLTLTLVLSTLYGQILDFRSLDLNAVKSVLAVANLLDLESIAGSAMKVLTNRISKATVSDLFRFSTMGISDVDVNFDGPYPKYTKGFAKTLADYVLRNFELDSEFTAVAVDLPYPILKYICENPALKADNAHQRHKFIASVLLARKGKVKFEESVVMSFENGGVKLVLVRRQLGKGKPLWKTVK